MKKQPATPDTFAHRQYHWCEKRGMRLAEGLCQKKYWGKTCGTVYKCKRWIERKVKVKNANSS